MTTPTPIPTLALERLMAKVAETFEDDDAEISVLEDANFGGSAVLTGEATAMTEVRVLFTVGGEIGVDADIAYKVSIDDGATYGDVTVLVGNTIEVAGVVATMTGTIEADNFLRWQTWSPVMPVFAFGSREPMKRGERYKISYVPGDDEDAGEIVQAKQPGRNPRPLHTFNERVTVIVDAAAIDVTPVPTPTSPAEDQLAQWREARLLMNAFVRAVYLAATCTYTFDRVELLHPERKFRTHGYAYKLVMTLEEMIPDKALTTAPVNVHASYLTRLTDNENQTIQQDGPDVVVPSGE